MLTLEKVNSEHVSLGSKQSQAVPNWSDETKLGPSRHWSGTRLDPLGALVGLVAPAGRTANYMRRLSSKSITNTSTTPINLNNTHEQCKDTKADRPLEPSLLQIRSGWPSFDIEKKAPKPESAGLPEVVEVVVV